MSAIGGRKQVQLSGPKSLRSGGETVEMPSRKTVAGVVFAIAASVPALLVLCPVLDRPMVVLLYIVAPMVCAFVAANLLAEKISYDETKKAHNLGPSLLVSVSIVLLSLVFWIIPAFVLLPSDERARAPGLALVAGALFPWAIFPPGLLAGLIVWRLSKTRG